MRGKVSVCPKIGGEGGLRDYHLLKVLKLIQLHYVPSDASATAKENHLVRPYQEYILHPPFRHPLED